MQEFKSEITQAHSSLQQENQDLKQVNFLNFKKINKNFFFKRFNEIESEYEKNKDTSRLLHQIESIGLDKEMAEEKAELLQSEVEALQFKLQEQENELSLLKLEIEKSTFTGVKNDSTVIDVMLYIYYNFFLLFKGCSIKVKQLQSENERLRDAILR